MPDPNDPTAEATIPPELQDAALISEGPELPEEEREAGEKSAIQDAMEDALRGGAAEDSGALSLKTYPISNKMRTRLLSEFMYHTPREDQRPRYVALRSMALTFATMIVELTPPSREQSLALTKVGEAIMHANAAIARGEDDRQEDTTEKTTEAPVSQDTAEPVPPEPTEAEPEKLE